MPLAKCVVVVGEREDDVMRLRLLVQVWGWRPLWLKARGGADVRCAVIAGADVRLVRGLMQIVLQQCGAIRVVVVGRFTESERASLQQIGVGRIVATDAPGAVLREAVSQMAARKRGPAKKMPASVLAPLSVAMEAAV